MDNRPLPERATSRAPLIAVLVIGAVLALTACASVETQTATSARTATASPVPIPGYDWFLHQHANQASLSYGLKDSDDLRLGLECLRGAGRVELSAVAATGVRAIFLESGGETERFAAQGEASQLHDGDFLTAKTKTDLSVFQRFRRIGWLAQWQGEQREIYAAHAASFPNIERFFSFCS